MVQQNKDRQQFDSPLYDIERGASPEFMADIGYVGLIDEVSTTRSSTETVIDISLPGATADENSRYDHLVDNAGFTPAEARKELGIADPDGAEPPVELPRVHAEVPKTKARSRSSTPSPKAKKYEKFKGDKRRLSHAGKRIADRVPPDYYPYIPFKEEDEPADTK